MEKKPGRFLKLDANEGRCVLTEAELASLLQPEVAQRYPDARPLENRLASWFGLHAGQIIATAGADDAIDRIFRAYGGPGKTILTTTPGFVEFLDTCLRTKSTFKSVYREPGEAFPLEAFLAVLNREKPAITILASPDNPAGTLIDEQAIFAIAETCKKTGTLFVFDITYIDFAEDYPLLETSFARLPWIVLTGSFSKSRGLAGFRAGWAACSSENTTIIDTLRDFGPPYSLSAPAIQAALMAIEVGDRFQAFVERVRTERRILTAKMAQLGAKTWQSQANFVTVNIENAQEFAERLLKEGIRVRTWLASPESRKLVRITCPGNEDEFEYLLSAIDAAQAGGKS